MIDKTAYQLPVPSSDDTLVKVGPGTPMGGLLRRYWQPVGISADASDVPRQIRVLCEDLILFRDRQGRPGLLYPRCAHRGTNLYYGRVEEAGIRCCYDGWMFDVRGHCVEQPCEPDSGGQHRARVRQPWYPLREEHGLLFAYMGPPEKMPALPVFPFMEGMADDEQIIADNTSIGSGGGAIVPCNWPQAFENVCDPFHVPILHGMISGLQFTDALSAMPVCEFDVTERGVRISQDRRLGDGRHFRRVTEAMVPNLRLVPHPRPDSFDACHKVGWVVPIDDTSHRIFSLVRGKKGSNPAWDLRQTFEGRTWHELSEAEHRTMPGDYEAQVGQGPITFHSQEHLATSDRGVVMLRRMLKQQIELTSRGDDPMNVTVGHNHVRVAIEAGNFILDESGG